MADVLLTPGELARRWSIPPGSLANDRYRGKGLTYVKIGSRVRYRLQDVEAYESASRVLVSSQ